MAVRQTVVETTQGLAEHPLCCDCLECLGGGPWPGAGRVIGEQPPLSRKAFWGRNVRPGSQPPKSHCLRGHKLPERIEERRSRAFACVECVRERSARRRAAGDY